MNLGGLRHRVERLEEENVDPVVDWPEREVIPFLTSEERVEFDELLNTCPELLQGRFDPELMSLDELRTLERLLTVVEARKAGL